MHGLDKLGNWPGLRGDDFILPYNLRGLGGWELELSAVDIGRELSWGCWLQHLHVAEVFSQRDRLILKVRVEGQGETVSCE